MASRPDPWTSVGAATPPVVTTTTTTPAPATRPPPQIPSAPVMGVAVFPTSASDPNAMTPSNTPYGSDPWERIGTSPKIGPIRPPPPPTSNGSPPTTKTVGGPNPWDVMGTTSPARSPPPPPAPQSPKMNGSNPWDYVGTSPKVQPMPPTVAQQYQQPPPFVLASPPVPAQPVIVPPPQPEPAPVPQYVAPQVSSEVKAYPYTAVTLPAAPVEPMMKAPMAEMANWNPDDELTIENFLKKNDPKGLETERDDFLGPLKWLFALVTLYFFFAAVFPILTSFGSLAWLLAIMWCPIIIIAIGYFEYYARAEVWHVMICKGIIVNFDKTKWFKKFLFFVDLVLIGLVVGLVFAMDKESENYAKRGVRAGLMALTMAFTIDLVRGIIGLEEANRIHTLNIFMSVTDKKMLEPRGFKMIHYTQIAIWSHEKKFKVISPNDIKAILLKQLKPPFSWNEVFALPPDKNHDGFAQLPFYKRAFWGLAVYNSIWMFKDMNE